MFDWVLNTFSSFRILILIFYSDILRFVIWKIRNKRGGIKVGLRHRVFVKLKKAVWALKTFYIYNNYWKHKILKCYLI